MNNLLLRGISGTLYVALIVGSLVFTNMAFMFLCMAFGIFAIVELNTLTCGRDGQPTSVCALDVFGMLCLTSWAVLTTSGIMPYMAPVFSVGTCYLLYLIVRLCASLYQKSDNAARDTAYSLFGQMYLGLGLVCAQILAMFSAGLVLLIFIFIWLNDTGAFLVGKSFGKHKLFERLSPKKTWEGFLGGLALCVATGVVLAFTGVSERMCSPLYLGIVSYAVVVPVAVCVFATLGDLFESMIKRSVGAKDSGRLIPGHGGILDRIDSMLFVMPALCVITLLCMMLNFNINV